MAHVTAFINLKGGVGKTTSAVAMAEILAGEFSKHVLLIDLDPQTNATVMLIGDARWDQLNKEGHTLAQLFADAFVQDDTQKRFDLAATLQRGASPVQGVRHLDLLPSSLDLIDLQDRLATIPAGRFYAINPVDLLHRAIKPIADEYDHIIIDCPPNLGIITLNGLRIATSYLIPTIPDHLSTYGIPQILTRVKGFADQIAEEITPLGIVFTKYRAASTVHNNTVRQLRRTTNLPLIFETIIPEANSIAAAADLGTLSTLRQRYGYAGQFEAYRNLAKEYLEALQ